MKMNKHALLKFIIKKRFICIYLPNGNPKGTEKYINWIGWIG